MSSPIEVAIVVVVLLFTGGGAGLMIMCCRALIVVIEVVDIERIVESWSSWLREDQSIPAITNAVTRLMSQEEMNRSLN